MDVPELAKALNEAAVDFEIGHLQELRMRLKGLTRPPCKGIFNRQTTFDDYAFHVGGRTELQFNIGVDLNGTIRHGLAFSLEPSQTLPDIGQLLPKVARFNDYVRSHPEDLPDFGMWHFDGRNRRSDDRPVSPIENAHVAVGYFIALGRRSSPAAVNVPTVLADFDRLLPLYTYVESGGSVVVRTEPAPFVSGCPKYMEGTTMSLKERTVDVALRHKALQPLLFRLLEREYGGAHMEYPLVHGGSVDAVAMQGTHQVYFELKVAPDVRACIRAALGQLLEYAHWPDASRADEFIVVGESAVDHQSVAYLRLLRERYRLPVWYRRLDADGEVLEPKQ